MPVGFSWTKKTETAAQLVAEGSLSFDDMAKDAGTTRPTLRKWRSHPEFQARVEEIREDYREGVRARGVAVRERRVASYNERWEKMQSVIDARARDKTMAGVPGGKTGLVILSDYKIIRDDEGNTEALPVYEVDTGLLKEMRELEKQAAQDLGQWTEKREVTGQGGGALAISIEQAIAKAYGEQYQSEN